MSLKHRLVGASVVIAGMVIFLPALVDSERRESRPISTEIELPPPPNYDFEEQTLPKPGQFDFRPSESEVAPVTPATPVDFEPPVDIPLGAFDEFSPPETPVEVAPKAAPKPEPSPKLITSKPEPVPPAKPVKPVATAPKPVVPRPSAPPANRPAVVGSVWVVQLGSFSRSGNAIELSDRLRKNGYSAFVERAGGPDQPAHRVKVGAESTRTGAEQLMRKLAETEKLNGFVTKHP